MSTVMVVDDEERIRSLLSRSLSTEGHSVVSAADGQGAMERLSRGGVDLVLLDLVMPGSGGLGVLATMQDRGDTTPVIVLSAVSEVGARVQALDRGAVDFVGKPFHTAELIARVRRHLTSRPAPQREHRFLEAGGIRLDLDRRRVELGGREVGLTEREFSLLAHLMRRRGDVCRRDELLHDVWGLDFDPGSNVVEVCVRRLRHKLAPNPPIETIRRVGYCFYGR
ncbi:response regulator transcription factor [Oryzihumus leptocrescens]|uniref:DNA-binding response OmpR family regulator n=1 Tax=Oryzihumus leptocrescens TaxID=297536 RepID=A0A542ZMX5_9MICO|nr:response regulator transcription factor [Oryzihumus leptocrescens]TQL61646.1 DNA-binding response OmpR family regulator [Oryzihumus leptocrescens]